MSDLKEHKGLLITGFCFLSLILILLSAFFIYTAIYYKADSKALEALASENIKIEEHNNFYSFMPDNPKAGIIFYPGAKVDEKAYAPLMLELTNHNYACFLVKMPFHLAFFGQNRADQVLEKYSSITEWYMMGHSLGGVVASGYANSHSQISGLILLASYASVDLSNSDLKVISIYGSNDGVLSLKNYEDSKKNLPSNFWEYVIEGGNHSGFGNYGHQKKDGSLELEDGMQINITSCVIDEFFYG